jgi:HTH-type transcriptional regulator/antitoxin MqsA
MRKNPRNYPDTMISAESGRVMTRGEKEIKLVTDGRSFTYCQPGWWCSLTDPEDLDGQLADEDNQVAEMARRTAKALARGESVFVPVIIRAIRQSCGLTQREAGVLFGGGEKSFEKYESGEIQPSEPMKRLLKLAMERPELFRKPKPGESAVQLDEATLIHNTLRAASVDRIYEPMFRSLPRPSSAPTLK